MSYTRESVTKTLLTGNKSDVLHCKENSEAELPGRDEKGQNGGRDQIEITVIAER